MADATGWAETLGYIGMDDAARAALARVRPALMAALPGLLDRFYARTLAQPELMALFGTRESADRARAAQARHWALMFEGHFDQSYRDSVQRIALTHLRIGLSPRWYLAGYGYILGELQGIVSRSQSGLVPRRGASALADSLRAVTAAVMLDVEEVMSAWWRHGQEQRTRIIDDLMQQIDVKVKETVESMDGYAQELSKSATTMSGVNAETNSGAAAASNAADVSMAATQSVAAAVEELNASIAGIARDVALSATTAEQAARGMGEAREVVDRLGQAASEIGEVVQFIAGIAKQTNLLALNATIEAARAGEAGKGFGVVATEVKSLALQTAKSANDIAQRIARIQEVTDSTVAAIRGAAETVSSMQGIAGTVSGAVEEQSAATSEIARHVAHTAREAAEVKRLMGVVSTSAEQAEKASDTVNNAVEQMDDALHGLGRLLTAAVRGSTDLGNRRSHPRRAAMIDAELIFDGRQEKAVLLDLSQGGAAARCEAAKKFNRGGRGEVVITGTTLRLPSTLTACHDDEVHIAFDGEGLPDAQVERLAAESVERIVEATKNDHRVWIARIRDAVEGKQPMAAAQLNTHHTCRLGRWYDRVSDPRLTELPAFRALAKPHFALHSGGKAVLLALEAGRKEAVAKGMAELDALSREIVGILDQIGEQYRRRAAA